MFDARTSFCNERDSFNSLINSMIIISSGFLDCQMNYFRNLKQDL